jgi:hypothetical protein
VHDRQVVRDRGGPLTGAHPVVVEREMDDAVGACGRGPQPVEVGEVTAEHGGAQRGHRRGGRVGPGQAGDLVPGGDELGDDGRADVPGRAGNENPHSNLLGARVMRLSTVTVAG